MVSGDSSPPDAVVQRPPAGPNAEESGDHGGRSPGRIGTVSAIGVWCTAVALITIAGIYVVSVRDADIDGLETLQPGDVIDMVINVIIVTLGAVIVLRSRSRLYGWLMLGVGAVNSVSEAASEFALHGWYVDGARNSLVIDLAIWVHDGLALAMLAAIVLWLPSLFPDGRPVGRWRRPFRVVTLSWFVWWSCFLFVTRPAEATFLDLPDAPDNPAGVLPEAMLNPVQMTWAVLMLASVVISIGSVRTRWRASVGEQRQQLKWVLFALGVAGVVMAWSVVEAFVGEALDVSHHDQWITTIAFPLAWAGVFAAIGAALLRYRLYEIDLVINRTMVYAAMSLVVVAVYALIVTSLAAAMPGVTDAGASLVAAGVVALAFAPVRGEVQGMVDRWVFGRRSDPLGVIADVGSTLATSDAPDAALQAIADTVVAALKVPGAAIVLGTNGDRSAVVAGELSRATEDWSLQYQGETVGRLEVSRRSPSEALTGADRQLLDNVAHYAAGVAHTVELNRALQRSRERLVVAREEERRRLRRDLHDGLGPTLASQTFRLDAALAQLESDPAAAAEHLHALKAQNRELVADIRRLVYELRPPALDELGLAGAVATYANQFPNKDLTVTTGSMPDPLGELPAAVEAAAYRIVTEAITNTARHAAAERCDVTIERTDCLLTIRVIDDGSGIPDDVTPGVGLRSMHERAAELGGSCSIVAVSTGGTCVITILPLATNVNPRSRM